MSKKKKFSYIVVSKDDTRKVPKKIFGCFPYTEEGRKLAEKHAELKSNKLNKLVVKVG